MNNYMKTVVAGIKNWVSTQFDKNKPDWTVNDPTDPRYVHGRTHWAETIENPERTILLPETVYSNPRYGRFLIETTEQLINNFKNGSTYIVTLNGVEYECVAHSGGIGNSSLQTGQEDPDSNNEPFWCQIDGGIADEWVLAVDISQGYPGTIQIEALAPRMIVHYLDAQYLINSNVRNGEGDYSIAEGYHTVATGDYGSHAEGEDTIASGNRSHAEGYNTSASGENSHAEGEDTTASGNRSHAEGSETTASGSDSHAEGWHTTASGVDSHAEGSLTKASENAAHAEGSDTTASGRSSHAEGEYTCAFGRSSHAEGRANMSYIYLTGEAGSNTYVLSNSSTITVGDYVYCSQYDSYAIVEDYDPSTKTITLSNTLSSDDALNKTSTDWMHGGIAYGEYSHIEGLGTKANSDCQHVQGKYNIADTENKYAHIVGNGVNNGGVGDTRSNAHTIDWNGLGWFAGGLKVGGTGQDDENAVEVATKSDISETVANLSTITMRTWTAADLEV